MRCSTLIAFIILLSCYFAVAAEESPSAGAMFFNHLASEDGLSQNSINTMIQDRLGYLWFGTQDGLNRYDGHGFTYFYHDPFDQSSLSNSYINDLEEAENGDIWVATVKGVNRISAETGQIHRYVIGDAENITQQHVQKLVIDRQGTVWASTWNGVFCLESGQTEFTDCVEYFANDDYGERIGNAALALDNEGVPWFCSANLGLARVNLSTRELEVFELELELPEGNSLGVYSLFFSSEGHVWIGTIGSGLIRYEPGRGVLRHYYKADSEGRETGYSQAVNFCEAADGTIYAACRNKGLLVIDSASGKTALKVNDPHTPSSLAGNDVIDVIIDETNTLWVSTSGMGISFYSPGMVNFETVEALQGEFVYAIIEDDQGHYWVGGYQSGLLKLDENLRLLERYRGDRFDMRAQSIRSLLFDSSGRLWVGTNQAGLLRFDEEAEQFEQILDVGEIWDLHEDSQGNIWCLSDSAGLWVIEKSTGASREIENFSYDPESQRTPIFLRAILEDTGGLFWIATNTGVFVMRRQGSGLAIVDHYLEGVAEGHALLSNQVISLHEDSGGKIYIGTRYGLTVVDPDVNNTIHFTIVEGLPNNVIYSISEDENGFIWLTTNKGISKFDPENKDFSNFFLSSGLQSMEFNTHAALRDSRDRLFFGGVKGVNWIKPGVSEEKQVIPEISFSSFELSGTGIGTLPFINSNPVAETRHDENTFAFRIMINDFRTPALNRYAYKVDPVDESWRYFTGSFTPNYHNLDPGRYTIRVKGANGDGIWSENERFIHLVVHPAFFNTNWFRIMIAGIVLFALIGVFFWRSSLAEAQRMELQKQLDIRTRDIKNSNEKLAQLNSELESFSYTVSHDLRSPITTIKGFLELLTEECEACARTNARDYQRRIQRNLGHMEGLIENLLKFSRSGRKELERKTVNFSLIARTTAEEILNGFDKEKYDIEIEDGLEVKADDFLLGIALFNLIHNACKYSKMQEHPRIEVGWDDERQAFFIRDNGAGFNPALKKRLFKPFERLHADSEFTGTGIGLATVNRVIQRHGGWIDADTDPESGTVFWFSFGEESAEENS